MVIQRQQGEHLRKGRQELPTGTTAHKPGPPSISEEIHALGFPFKCDGYGECSARVQALEQKRPPAPPLLWRPHSHCMSHCPRCSRIVKCGRRPMFRIHFTLLCKHNMRWRIHTLRQGDESVFSHNKEKQPDWSLPISLQCSRLP